MAIGEKATRSTGRWLGTGSNALAPEFSRADLSPVFRVNGSVHPAGDAYAAHVASSFANWQLVVDGLVGTPLALSLAQLLTAPQRTQITRHDCVEGWSAIGEWTGVPLGLLLNRAGLSSRARYIVFHCADTLMGKPYYESIDVAEALHPQTILAHSLNRTPLSIGHGAPLRLRVERQLGYKQAKYVMRVQAVDNLNGLYGGKGGFWEDNHDYQWYAGI
jgi:DMSO/TMAO reductase YedYZ molybdopterin-dependent catalytic subunit